MCKLVDDYAKEIADQRDVDNIRNMFSNNGSLELAISTFINTSEETIRGIYEEMWRDKPVRRKWGINKLLGNRKFISF